MAHPDIHTDRWRKRLEEALDLLRDEARAQGEDSVPAQWVPGELHARVVQAEGHAARLVIEIPIEELKRGGAVGTLADNDPLPAASSTFWEVEEALSTCHERLRTLEREGAREGLRVDALRREIDALEQRQIELLDGVLAAHRAVLPERDRVQDVLARHGIGLPESLASAR